MNKILEGVLWSIGLLLPQWLFSSQLYSYKKHQAGHTYVQHSFKSLNMKLYSFEGSLMWTLKAQSAVSQNQNRENIWNLGQVELDHLLKAGALKMTGQTGRLDLNKKMELKGKVKAWSPHGYVFKTDKIQLMEERGDRVFYTNDQVHLYNQAEHLKVKALGLRGFVNSGEVELLNQVRCHKDVEGYRDIRILSDQARIQSVLQGIRFKDNLRIQQGKMILKGEEAFFVYNKKSKALDSIQIDGSISATDGVKTALSESVKLKPQEDVIIFQGSPRVKMGKNEMVGEEILITNGQKNIQVRRGNIKTTDKEVH